MRDKARFQPRTQPGELLKRQWALESTSNKRGVVYCTACMNGKVKVDRRMCPAPDACMLAEMTMAEWRARAIRVFVLIFYVVRAVFCLAALGVVGWILWSLFL